MPRIHLCFLWHMHQPYYKDLATGEYKLPWTRLHALKDYYGMVRMLEEFPQVRQTFNLVPSMMAQVAEYAAGEAADPFLALALKPAADLTPEEQVVLLRNSFHAHPQRMIRRYPRYAELYAARESHADPEHARRLFGERDFRDLQMLSQIAWFDEEFLERDPEVREWIARGRDFTASDQERMGAKQREIVGAVLPAYQKLAATGQIEISTTPYYHPILPLLCDSDIGGVSHPGVPLPPRFRYPGDARLQLEMARDYVAREFGAAPAGLWPSEGSVSDEALALAADTGFTWAATDSGVLGRTLDRDPDIAAIYRPYRWERDGRAMNMMFRDHLLSDLIGFVYANMDAREAAGDFLRRIHDNAAGVLAAGRDALVPIILDGENAWEYYDRNGRPFLRELYARIAADPRMEAVTAAEAFRRIPAEPLGHIFPGSWIGANFDVWIGAEEDNRAWALLLRARETFEAARGVPDADLRLAREELLIAEGSDWCWWYGPEHNSANRAEFDQLYRGHLANVYRALGKAPPEELSRPILRVLAGEFHLHPTGAITPVIDGEITSYFEWLGAGIYRKDERSGAMHAGGGLVQEIQYGIGGDNFYLRLDFNDGADAGVSALEARLLINQRFVTIRFDGGRAAIAEMKLDPVPEAGMAAAECAFKKMLEVRVALPAVGVKPGDLLRFQIALWRGNLPVESIPQQGWLEMAATEAVEWSA